MDHPYHAAGHLVLKSVLHTKVICCFRQMMALGSVEMLEAAKPAWIEFNETMRVKEAKCDAFSSVLSNGNSTWHILSNPKPLPCIVYWHGLKPIWAAG